MAKRWIGVDIGGTNTVCGLLDDEGRLLAVLKRPTEAVQGSEAVLNKVAGMVSELLEAERVSVGDVAAAGIGAPGFVDPVTGTALNAGNLNWKNVPVASRLSKLLSMPVYADNDVRMYVYGEAMAGAGRHYRNVLGVTVGTGLAAAYVQDGKLFYGGRYMAGELGHILMNEISYPCVCGLTGCLETVASGTGIVRQARDHLRAGHRSVLRNIPLERITSADVSHAYDAGDPLAIEILHRTGRLLGKGLAGAITLFSPDIVVIGGGVAAAGDRLLKPMKEAIRTSVFEDQWASMAIAVASRLEHAGIIGSALYAKDRLRESGV